MRPKECVSMTWWGIFSIGYRSYYRENYHMLLNLIMNT